jgi:uncharacterized protein YkwD
MSALLSVRRLGALVLLLAALLFMLPGSSGTAEAATKAEKLGRRLINAERIEEGLYRLRMSDRLVRIAKRHSRAMADDGTIYHSKNLVSKLPWTNVWSGENVGMGTSVRVLHALFMTSDGHRANILHSEYDRVGVGVVKRDGLTFITVIFVGIP